MATRYIKLELPGLSEVEYHVMRNVILHALEEWGMTENAVLCVEEENEDGIFEPIESQCINVFE